MEEDEFRATYRQINTRRCVFEKAINSRVCSCEKARRFHLADREGVSCESEHGHDLCEALLNRMRENARFALRTPKVDGPLPHSREIRVQNGGLFGLNRLLGCTAGDVSRISNIFALTTKAESRFGTLDRIPYAQIIQSILAYQGRPRRPRRPD